MLNMINVIYSFYYVRKRRLRWKKMIWKEHREKWTRSTWVRLYGHRRCRWSFTSKTERSSSHLFVNNFPSLLVLSTASFFFRSLSLFAFIFLPFLIFLDNLYPISLAQGGEEQTRYDTDHLDLFRYPNPKSSSPFHFLNDHRYSGCLSIPNLFASRFADRRVTSLTCLEWKSLDSMELLFVLFFLSVTILLLLFLISFKLWEILKLVRN